MVPDTRLRQLPQPGGDLVRGVCNGRRIQYAVGDQATLFAVHAAGNRISPSCAANPGAGWQAYPRAGRPCGSFMPPTRRNRGLRSCSQRKNQALVQLGTGRVASVNADVEPPDYAELKFLGLWLVAVTCPL